jgi:hypothetical protein
LDEIAVDSGGYPGDSFEVSVEMALIGKTDLTGRFRQVDPPADQLFRPANPDLGKVSVRSEARFRLENTDQMERTQARFSRQSGKGNILMGEIFYHPLRRQHGGMFPSCFQEWIGHVRVTTDESYKHMQQSRLHFQSSHGLNGQAEVKRTDFRSKLRVAYDPVLEKGETDGFAAHQIGGLLEETGVEIQHPVGPALLRCRMAIMRFAGIDEIDAPGRGNQRFSAIGKFQGALLNDPEGKSVMAVSGEILGDIGRLHQRQPRQSGKLFDGCVFSFFLCPFHVLNLLHTLPGIIPAS